VRHVGVVDACRPHGLGDADHFELRRLAADRDGEELADRATRPEFVGDAAIDNRDEAVLSNVIRVNVAAGDEPRPRQRQISGRDRLLRRDQLRRRIAIAREAARIGQRERQRRAGADILDAGQLLDAIDRVLNQRPSLLEIGNGRGSSFARAR
jgi:hypothetical protein